MPWYDFTTGITASAEYTTNQTLSSSTQFVLADASAADMIITLPAAADNTRTVYTIKKMDSSSNKVTIDANGTETIDGEETIVLKSQYSYVTIVCDGTEWFIIGGMNVKIETIMEDLLDEQRDHKTELEHLLLILGKVEKHIAKSEQDELDIQGIKERLDEEFDKL